MKRLNSKGNDVELGKSSDEEEKGRAENCCEKMFFLTAENQCLVNFSYKERGDLFLGALGGSGFDPPGAEQADDRVEKTKACNKRKVAMGDLSNERGKKSAYDDGQIG